MTASSTDPSFVDLALDSRAVTFENPAGARGAGGTAAGGRKGVPNRRVQPGETVVLADLAGPGVVRHTWLTIPPAPPEVLRAQVLEVFYDDADEPSISVPVVDFFGLAHGRLVPLASAMTAIQEGRGLNSYLPMPFHERIRVEYTNHADRTLPLYVQLDLTLQDLADGQGLLHATFRRENPTTPQRDFVISDGLRGPGRFLGCVVGVRVLDEGLWYGEGEVKVFLDGDDELPTICGTGLEDYVGSAWGLGAHQAPYGGAPLDVHDEAGRPRFVSFYRWHVPDPIVFREDLRVTIQQIGAMVFAKGDDAARDAYVADHPLAGNGWQDLGAAEFAIFERVDDYCATAFVYALEPQAVPRIDVAAALADIERLPNEVPDPMEGFLGPVRPDD